MISKRDLLIGGACLGAAGLAYALEPRRKLVLLGNEKMEAIVPKAFAGWTSAAAEGLVKPKLEGLAAESRSGGALAAKDIPDGLRSFVPSDKQLR